MSNANDPAFPILNGAPSYPGLTKREYFAAMAMQGFIHCNLHADNSDLSIKTLNEMLAQTSVIAADALIAELAKGKE